MIAPAGNPSACSNAALSSPASSNAFDSPLNAALPPPNFWVAPAMMTDAWSTLNPNSLNCESYFRKKV